VRLIERTRSIKVVSETDTFNEALATAVQTIDSEALSDEWLRVEIAWKHVMPSGEEDGYGCFEVCVMGDTEREVG
jgi:hypothetical protein